MTMNKETSKYLLRQQLSGEHLEYRVSGRPSSCRSSTNQQLRDLRNETISRESNSGGTAANHPPQVKEKCNHSDFYAYQAEFFED